VDVPRRSQLEIVPNGKIVRLWPQDRRVYNSAFAANRPDFRWEVFILRAAAVSPGPTGVFLQVDSAGFRDNSMNADSAGIPSLVAFFSNHLYPGGKRDTG